MSLSSDFAFDFEDAQEVACQCRRGEGPSDVKVLAHAVLSLHAHAGCGRELLGVVGRLYTVVAEHAALVQGPIELNVQGVQNDRCL